MKSALEVCLITFAMTCVAVAQDPAKPALRQGISVKMPMASHAVEVRAADAEDATVVSVTADGKVFVDVPPVETTALSSLNEGTVYVKTAECLQPSPPAAAFSIGLMLLEDSRPDEISTILRQGLRMA